MIRLNSSNLSSLCASHSEIETFKYAREKIQAGIVHLGIGAFHRAHQAVYTEAVLNQMGGDWAIVGASLRSPAVQEQLQAQDTLYTVVERGPEGEKYKIVGAVKAVLVGPENPEALVAIMSEPAVKIVSLTVTEKGYCHDPASGDLNFSHPDIQHDLEQPSTPKSAIGFIVAALQARRRAGAQSFTALSCDNLPHNGHVLAKTVKQFAARLDVELAEWIELHTSFPNTMIDRIVPATTAKDRDEFEKTLGYRDEGMVLAEPFSQWVIENNFCNDRPAWEQAGALLVDDVAIFEKMKLRLLNGSHSTLAYCGYLAGKNYISEVMQEPLFVRLCEEFMDREAGATLISPEGFNIDEYKRQLRERFSNPGLKHRTWQIAMDGSQKLPQRLLQTLREQLAEDGPIDIICLAVAAWIRYVSGVDEKGEAIDVQDPWASRLRELHVQHGSDSTALVKSIIGINAIFGEDLISQARFVDRVQALYDAQKSQGILATIKAVLNRC